METQFAKSRICPTCGNRMVFFKGIPGVGSVPELRIYKCKECGVRKTETKVASDDFISPKPNLYVMPATSSLLH